MRRILVFVGLFFMIGSAFATTLKDNDLVQAFVDKKQQLDHAIAAKAELTPEDLSAIQAEKMTLSEMKKELRQTLDFDDNPIYQTHNIQLDLRIELLDCYVYPWSDTSDRLVIRVKNNSSSFLDWVKLE